jgi:hypothetical protein
MEAIGMQEYEKSCIFRERNKLKVNLPAMSFEIDVINASNINEEIHKQVDKMILLALLLNSNVLEKT